jgi:hypothetical protein
MDKPGNGKWGMGVPADEKGADREQITPFCTGLPCSPAKTLSSGLRSIGFVSCGFEEIVAFFFLEEGADVTDRLPELVVCSNWPTHSSSKTANGHRKQLDQDGYSIRHSPSGVPSDVRFA